MTDREKRTIKDGVKNLIGKYKVLEHGIIEVLENNILSFIDSIEVQEVDLEDTKKEELTQEYVDYTFKRYNIDANSKEGQLIYYAFMHGINKCLMQLRTQKGKRYDRQNTENP